MKKIKKITLFILALCFFTAVFAQQKVIIRGRVVDIVDKSPVVGANVIEYDKDNRVVNGTVCDINGDFVLTMKDIVNKIKVSYMGYNIQEVKVDPTKSMMIELVASVKQIDEVVVTAMAQTKRNTLTNIDDRDKASSSVRMDLRDMKESGALSVADALQGRVSGLDILSASGDPGSGSRIVIRGLSSIGNSKPLIVIDGIPQASPPGYSDFDLSSADAEDIGTLINMSIQDIKSVEILKDAAATAQYGSKGADGVLLIETHKGRKGNVNVFYTYKKSLNIQPPAIPMLTGDEYIMLQQEELHNESGIMTWPDGIDPLSANAYLRNNYTQNINWIKEITKNAVTDDHYVNLMGGGEKANYFTSLSYVDEGGTTINTGSKTFSTRLNLDYNMSEKIFFNLTFSYTHFTREDNVIISNPDNSYEKRDIRQMAYIKAPNMSIWEYDANGQPTGEYFVPQYSYQGSGEWYYNPVAVANEGTNDLRRNSLLNGFTFRYRFKPWLTFNQTASIQISGEKANTFLPKNALGNDWVAWNANLGGEQNQVSQTFTTQSQLLYKIPLTNTKHEIYGALTWNTEQARTENMQVQSNRLPSSDTQDPAMGAHINWMGEYYSESRFLESVLSLNYKFADKYLFQSTYTRDGHTSFGKNNRWGSFYGISGAWRFSEEPFLKQLPFMGESKLRVSYGLSGRQPNDSYARFALYNTMTGYLDEKAIVPQGVQLNNFKFETTASINIGLDLNLFKDRFNAVLELYKKTTTDLLFKDYATPSSSGYSSIKYLNGGELENMGWELMTDYKVIKRNDFIVSLKFNVSQNQNTFISLPENFNKEKSTDIGNGKFPQIIVEGEPIGSFYGFRFKGVYATDADAVAKDVNGNVLHDINGAPIPMTYGSYIFKGGDSKYEDVNHDGKIDLNDVVYIGNSNPKLYGGFGTDIRYKNLSLSCHFQFRLGHDIVNMIAVQTQGMNDRNNQSKAVLRRWRAQGQSESDMLPRAIFGNSVNNLGSDRYVERGDFLRLINVMIGYKLGKKYCDKLHLNSMSITLSGRKLATFTNYSGQDPEVSPNAADPFWIGADYSRTPPPQVMTLALTLGL
jgi:TonB-linked SusC/RagA family outer membrane protein